MLLAVDVGNTNVVVGVFKDHLGPDLIAIVLYGSWARVESRPGSDVDLKEHIQATYGDEATFTPPWELFNEAQAEAALTAARRAVVAAGEVYRTLHGSSVER